MVHKLFEHYNTYVYINYFHNSWFVLYSHFHRIFQTHTMHTPYKHATLHIPHWSRYTTTTHWDFNLHIHFYEWNSNDVNILINWHISIVGFSSHFKIILDFPIADETYTYFLTNCFLFNCHSTNSVKFHHVTVNTLCYSMIHFVYSHVIVMYNFVKKYVSVSISDKLYF